MDIQPRIKKFAVIGTSCSGKTTTVYNVVGKLRKEGIHIEGLTSTDRMQIVIRNPCMLSQSIMYYIVYIIVIWLLSWQWYLLLIHMLLLTPDLKLVLYY